MPNLAKIGTSAAQYLRPIGNQIARTANQGICGLINGAFKISRFILKNSIFIAAAVFVLLYADIHYDFLPYCSSVKFLEKNPNGLPYYNEYGQQLAEFVRVPESQLSQGWIYLSRGTSKAIYEHPALPNYLVKVGCEAEMDAQFQNVEIAKEIIQSNHLDRLKLPLSSRIANLTGHGISVSLDEKFQFEESFNTIDSKSTFDLIARFQMEKGVEQLKKLISLGYFCDIDLNREHNAGFLKDKSYIGIYDLDCRWNICENLMPPFRWFLCSIK